MLDTASHNLLAVGLTKTRQEPCSLVIMSGAGDLTKRKLLPGTKLRIRPVEMDFQYQITFEGPSPEACERLQLDVMAGDAALFMRRDEVEASWTWIKNIQESWEKEGTHWRPEFVGGSAGPIEVDKLIEGDHRKWRTL